MQTKITKEMWGTLTEDDKKKYLGQKGKGIPTIVSFPTVGKLIAFLGNDLEQILHDVDTKKWYVNVYIDEDMWAVETFKHKELVNALFEAVKNKLKST